MIADEGVSDIIANYIQSNYTKIKVGRNKKKFKSKSKIFI